MYKTDNIYKGHPVELTELLLPKQKASITEKIGNMAEKILNELTKPLF